VNLKIPLVISLALCTGFNGQVYADNVNGNESSSNIMRDTSTIDTSISRALAPEDQEPRGRLHKSSTEETRRLQKALNEHGAHLRVDGYMRQETKMALRDFQKENNLIVTGILDTKTKNTLEM